MAYNGPKKKKPRRMISHLIDIELYQRLKTASVQDNMTMTGIIGGLIEGYLEERDKYYNGDDPQAGAENEPDINTLAEPVKPFEFE